MNSLQDDIGTLRKRGESDANILNALKAYQPGTAGDIDTLLKQGEDPTKVLDAFAAYHDQPAPEPERTFVGALRQGVASTLAGEAQTLRQTTGDGSATAALDGGANLVKPDGYTPADQSMGKNATWGQWFKALPFRVAESLPGTAQDLSAGAAGGATGALIGGPFAEVTGPAGALIGFGGSYLARSFGSDAKANAVARTGDDNATPNSDDKARALAQGVAGAALSRVGLGAAGGSVVKAVGGNLVRDVGAQVIKGAAADAATSAGSDAVHQVLTPGGQPLDTNSLFNSAATGAVTGGGLRLAKGVSDGVNTAKFSDIDPDVGQRLAARFSNEDTSSPSASFGAIGNVRRALGTEVQRFAQDAGPQIRDLQSSVGPHDDTALMVAKARADLKAGQPIDGDTLDTLSGRLGSHQEGANLVDALAEHSALNQVVQSGNYDTTNERFGGGATGNGLVQRFVRPFGASSLAEAGAASVIPALLGHGFRPDFTAGTLGAQAGLYGALSGLDHLLGVANPLDQFTQRFMPDAPPPSIMAGNANLPSFRQPGPGPQGSNGGAGGGPTPGPSGAPLAGNTPSPVSPSPTPSQSPPVSPAGGQPAPGPAPTAPVMPLNPGPTPVPAPGPGGPLPSPASPAAPAPVMTPQLALARAMAKAAPAASGEQPSAPAPQGALTMARAMTKAKAASAGDEGAQTKSADTETKPRIGVDYHHDPENGRIIVNHREHTVVRGLDGVQRVGDYATATHRNLVIRQQHFDAVAPLVTNAHDKGVMDELHHSLNQRSRTWDDAVSHIQEAVEEKMHEPDWSKRAAIANKLLEPRMRATWKQ